MQKSVFKIAKMDCPSEEQLIKMALADFKDINALDFDLQNRMLTVFHSGSHDHILQKLNSLQLDTSLINTVSVSSGENIHTYNNETRERKLLWQVLGINFFFFLLEIITGIISKSMGLFADSLDMLSDSIVYALALFAVGGLASRKKNIAKAAGYFQLTLTAIGFIEVIRRFAGLEAFPDFKTMIIISVLALIGNAICLYLLQKSKSKEAHMQASMIFTSNDVIVNLGVILAGALVYFTNSRYPDLVIGAIVFFIVGRGAFKILKLSR